MQSPRLSAITSRLAPRKLRTSFRRSSSTSSRASLDCERRPDRRSDVSTPSEALSPINAINSIVLRQKSVVDLEDERKSFASELDILEPRPVVYWGSLEEQLDSFKL